MIFAQKYNEMAEKPLAYVSYYCLLNEEAWKNSLNKNYSRIKV